MKVESAYSFLKLKENPSFGWLDRLVSALYLRRLFVENLGKGGIRINGVSKLHELCTSMDLAHVVDASHVYRHFWKDHYSSTIPSKTIQALRVITGMPIHEEYLNCLQIALISSLLLRAKYKDNIRSAPVGYEYELLSPWHSFGVLWMTLDHTGINETHFAAGGELGSVLDQYINYDLPHTAVAKKVMLWMQKSIIAQE